MANGDENPLPHHSPPQSPDRIGPAAADAPGPGVPEVTPGHFHTVLPEDLRVPWTWFDILLLALLAAGGAFLSGTVIALVLGFFHISPRQLQESPTALGLFAVLAQIVLDLGLMAYLAAQMRLRFSAPFWRTIGWRQLKTPGISRGIAFAGLVAGGFILAQVVSFAEPLFPPKHALPLQTMLGDPRVAVLFVVMGVLLAPVVEETIFRGYLYPVIARTLGVGAGIGITGVLFGLLHAVQLWGGWWQITLLVFVGVVLTSVRAATRTVVASYVVHVSYNAFTVIAPLITPLRFHVFQHTR